MVRRGVELCTLSGGKGTEACFGILFLAGGKVVHAVMVAGIHEMMEAWHLHVFDV